AQLAFLPHASERRGNVEGHDHLFGGVSGDVPVVPVDMSDAFDLLSVGSGSAIEVFVLKVLSNLYQAWHTSIYIDY
ncbi:MAG: hypothetical protein ACKPKO_52125, partial [Candidatus Fonsibacter sp.]